VSTKKHVFSLFLFKAFIFLKFFDTNFICRVFLKTMQRDYLLQTSIRLCALAEPEGIGTGGTIVGPIAAGAVLDDLKRAVDEMVTALLWEREGFSLTAWRRAWEQAK